LKIVPKSGTIVLKMGTNCDNDSLASALLGKTRRAVLAVLFGHPDERFYVRQVVRLVNAGVGTVQRELKRLACAGILKRYQHGNQVYYQANADCPIYAELQGLIIKTVGVADVLRTALASITDRIDVAFVYGSIARSEQRRESDVDVLVIGAVAFGEVVTALGPAQEKLMREINPTVYPRDEFKTKLSEGNHFLRSVVKSPKVFLIGTEDGLRRLV
jgi:predicted nucleotidyltransferase